MDNIKPTDSTTEKEIRERLKYIENTADDILTFSLNDEINKNASIQKCRELRKFVDGESHVLSLSRNKEVVVNNTFLMKYANIFRHMHFRAGMITKRNLSWNLDEFHQGVSSYDL
ncbi:hypothetical protein [Liquorilactobacillus hordei]|uniref:Uncharacterized protein n=1 Tax=Liquorilactobacillus hordei TaxID=468911 RepID=A0A3S6QTL1_9LACO|nr:hypothetical protein [Liquorilactobacillus hordei]AUJ29615.1 hypothetical protein BSQ49_05015 [Liquorilactobacillus hordei]